MVRSNEHDNQLYYYSDDLHGEVSKVKHLTTASIRVVSLFCSSIEEAFCSTVFFHIFEFTIVTNKVAANSQKSCNETILYGANKEIFYPRGRLFSKRIVLIIKLKKGKKNCSHALIIDNTITIETPKLLLLHTQ